MPIEYRTQSNAVTYTPPCGYASVIFLVVLLLGSIPAACRCVRLSVLSFSRGRQRRPSQIPVELVPCRGLMIGRYELLRQESEKGSIL